MCSVWTARVGAPRCVGERFVSCNLTPHTSAAAGLTLFCFEGEAQRDARARERERWRWRWACREMLQNV
jgi:hypothetical protein